MYIHKFKPDRNRVHTSFSFFTESGGHVFRDLLDDIRTDLVRHYRHADQDQRARRKNRLPRIRLFDYRYRHPYRSDGTGWDWFQAQSQGKGVHRSVVDGEGDRAGGPGARCPRRGRQERSSTGRICRDGADDVRTLGTSDRSSGCHHHHAVGAEVAD